MKKTFIAVLSVLTINISYGNLNDPEYYQCWEEESYADYQDNVQEFKGKIFEEFNKFVDCVNNESGKCNNGFILHGPPGNGKSTIATDFAKKIKAFTLRVTGSIEGPYTGTSTERLDRLFEHAKHLAQYNSVVIIIDEIDTLLRSTNNGNDPQSNHQAQNAGHFVKLLDNLPKDNSVTVIGTTNFLTSLDSRIRRGRRLAEIEIGNPNDADRKEILRHYLTEDKINISDNILNLIVKKTKGFCSADLQQLVNEISIKQSNQAIDDNIVKSELDRAIKNHKKYEAHVSEEAERRQKQDMLLDSQISNSKLQRIVLYGGIGFITGAAITAAVIYGPAAIVAISAQLGGTSATAGAGAATTATATAGTATATAGTSAVAGTATAATVSANTAGAITAGGYIGGGAFVAMAKATE